ncbi:hypothetical protein CF319_g7496 [Tilletia indica]|nr:hypothetical protein CF319_g7496 [Tilletia indica]
MNLYLEPKISALVAEKCADLRNQIGRLNADKERLTERAETVDRMLRTRLRLSGLHFHFLPDSEYSRPWTRQSLSRISRDQGRKMGAHLVVATDGNIKHSFLLNNPAYRYCLYKFGHGF